MTAAIEISRTMPVDNALAVVQAMSLTRDQRQIVHAVLCAANSRLREEKAARLAEWEETRSNSRPGRLKEAADKHAEWLRRHENLAAKVKAATKFNQKQLEGAAKTAPEKQAARDAAEVFNSQEWKRHRHVTALAVVAAIAEGGIEDPARFAQTFLDQLKDEETAVHRDLLSAALGDTSSNAPAQPAASRVRVGASVLADIRNYRENPNADGKIRPAVIVAPASTPGWWLTMGFTTNPMFRDGRIRKGHSASNLLGIQGRGWLWGNRLTAIPESAVTAVVGTVDEPTGRAILRILEPGQLTDEQVAEFRATWISGPNVITVRADRPDIQEASA